MGDLLSATRCHVDRQTINAGIITLVVEVSGWSWQRGLIDPQLYTRRIPHDEARVRIVDSGRGTSVFADVGGRGAHFHFFLGETLRESSQALLVRINTPIVAKFAL